MNGLGKLVFVISVAFGSWSFIFLFMDFEYQSGSFVYGVIITCLHIIAWRRKE